jgi:hypothetical protein
MLGAATLVYILLVAVSGCGKNSVAPEAAGVTPFQYLPPNSPQNVLQNLVSAYVRRDSVATAAVYDSTYQGTSTMPSAPIPVLEFTRADEIHHISALQQNRNVVSLSVDLGPPSTWQRLPADASDPADWAVIPIQFFRVEIRDAGTGMVYMATNNLMEYAFRPRVIAPGDTTWTVVRWIELAN